MATHGAGGSEAKSTLLDLLVARRPDLPHLELSAANTNVAMPYLDLANEVMTQVIYTTAPGYAGAPGYNGEPGYNSPPVYYNTKPGQDSRDLLAQPFHINYNMYKYVTGILPIKSLPYDPYLHRRRVFLRAMGTSLLELMVTFPLEEN